MHATRQRPLTRGWAPVWGFARVHGASMAPALRDGDRLVVSYRAQVRRGSIVVARLTDGTIAVKRAVDPRSTAAGRSGWWVLSDDPAVGVDSRHRGPVAEPDVLAVVVARVWPHPSVSMRRSAPSGQAP